MIDWNRHIFYLLGYLYKSIFTLDIKSVIENYYWIKIHLSCKSSSSGKMRFTKEELLGYIITLIILLILIRLTF